MKKFYRNRNGPSSEICQVTAFRSRFIAIHLTRWLANFYDFRFKWTATAGIGIHPTKPWLSRLVIFKNAILTWGLLLEGPMEVLLCERVNDLRHSLFHLLNCLITTGQIVCDKDGIVDWCIVLLEMPLTPFEECWPLPTESLTELP